jgi:hypothetical protein
MWIGWGWQIQYYGNQVNAYLMDAVNFFRSTWSQTRANAAMFIGTSWRSAAAAADWTDRPSHTYACQGSCWDSCPRRRARRSTLTTSAVVWGCTRVCVLAMRCGGTEDVCVGAPRGAALTLLIKDDDATVRIKCSEAISMLYDY